MVRKVTIKTIAKEYGVTPATVSKALRDSSDIAKGTRKNIKDLADKLGYQPNFMARSLVSKQSNIIGMIMPDISTSFFGFTVRGINDEARKFGKETIILVNNENYVEERKNLEFLAKLQVEGIIIDAVPGEHNIDLISKLIKRGIRFVFVDRKCDQIKIDSVTTNDVNAGYSMSKYFIKNNKKKIAFIGAIDTISVARERLDGYKLALKESGISFNPRLVIPIGYEIHNSKLMDTVRKFIRTGISFDAFICAGGLIAYLVGLVLLEEGFKIPKDILLGEFGDNNIVHRLGVPFVTVDQSPYEIGKKALQILVNQINEPIENSINKNVQITAKLIYHNPAEHKHTLIQEV